MKTQYIELTDGSRLAVNINFGTLYYLQKTGTDRMIKKIGKRKPTDNEGMELAAKLIYVIMRSNGKTVSQNEAMELMPMDTDVIEELLSEFMKKMDDFKKKQDAKRNMQNQRRK